MSATTQLTEGGGCVNCSEPKENANPNNDCLCCCITPPQQQVQPSLPTSKIHPVAARGIETLRNSEYYDMKGTHPHAKEDYYLHRRLSDYIIFILVQLNESTTHIVLSLLLCVTMNSIHTVEGFTNFASKTDMMANVSALAFACISDFFAQIPGNVDYGNNLAMFGYNSRIYCLLQMILDKETQQWIESNFCLPWTKEEAEARIFAIKVLVDVCNELGIPVLHLNFGGGGTKAAIAELKKIKSDIFFCVDITSHLATFTKYYSVFRGKVKQKLSLTTKAESMDAPIDQFLKIALSRMHRLDSSCTLEVPEMSFSDMLKNNERITYVCHRDDEMRSTRADMERVKEKKKEQKRLMKLAASTVLKQCEDDWTPKNPKVTSKDTSTSLHANDVIQPRSSWTSFDFESGKLQNTAKNVKIVAPRSVVTKVVERLVSTVEAGKRMALVNKLAKCLNKKGELPKDDLVIQAEFDQYVQLTKLEDRVIALQQLRNTRAAQDDNDRLILMTKLAKCLDNEGNLPPLYNADFDKFVQLTKLKKPEVALQQLRNTRAAQDDNDRLILMTKLAKCLDNEGNLPPQYNDDFDQYVELTKKKDRAIALQQLRNMRAAQDDNDRLILMTKLAKCLDNEGNLPPQYNTDFDKFVQLTKLKDRVVALQQLRNKRAAQDNKSYANGGTLIQLKSGKTTYRTNAEIVDLLMQHADLNELRNCNSANSLRSDIMAKHETLENIAWSNRRWVDQNETGGIKSLLFKALGKEKKEVIQINKEPNALAGIEKPGPNDVMTGRGGGTNSHPGNIKFRRIVEDKKSTYQASTTKEKTDLTKEVVADWRASNPPGRFLQLNKQTQLWEDIGDSLARTKCSALFREKTKKRKATDVEAISVQDGSSSIVHGEKDTVRESKKRKATEVEPITLQDKSIDPPHHTVPHNQTILLEGFKWDDDGEQAGSGIVDESSIIYTSSGRVFIVSNASQCICSEGMVGSLGDTKKQQKWYL